MCNIMDHGSLDEDEDDYQEYNVYPLQIYESSEDEDEEYQIYNG